MLQSQWRSILTSDATIRFLENESLTSVKPIPQRKVYAADSWTSKSSNGFFLRLNSSVDAMKCKRGNTCNPQPGHTETCRMDLNGQGMDFHRPDPDAEVQRNNSQIFHNSGKTVRLGKKRLKRHDNEQAMKGESLQERRDIVHSMSLLPGLKILFKEKRSFVVILSVKPLPSVF